MNKYFNSLSNEVNRAYDLANEARSTGLDPSDEVEISRANNVAEKVVGLIFIVAPQIKDSGVVERISELEKEYAVQDWRVAFKIAEEIAKEKLCKFKNKHEAMEVGLRVGLAYITNGVVSSPLEGFIRLELKKRKDGKEYFCLYFGGPIRSAGTTAVCAFVALADYVRKCMGYLEYDPINDEIKRSSTEVNYFHDRITNLQYLPSNEELEFLTEKLPLQIDGDPSERLEVPNYKDLSRVSTNILRNGYCLVMGEGLAQKGKKFWGVFSKWYKDFGMHHWKFMEDFIHLQKKMKSGDEVKKDLAKIPPDYTYVRDLVAGRPILGFPLRSGGFRLRYGRSRLSGLSSMSIHPATMHILNNYIATGTQLRYERPGKSSAMAPCDSIEGPIVKLKNGDVVFLEDVEVAKRVSKDVEEILYLGDMLVNYGEFLNRAHILAPPGYCEEWWLQELKAKKVNVDKNVSFDEAYDLSKKHKLALHPRYTFHWNVLEVKQLLSLIDWMAHAVIKNEKIIFPLLYDVEKDLVGVDPKRALELLGVPHLVINQEYVVVEGGWAKALRCCFNAYKKKFNVDYLLKKFDRNKSVLEVINDLSEVKIRDKCGLYIGTRMGRPEKAKLRKMTGDPHVLFPVGKEGGRFRSFQSAIENGKINAQFSIYKCVCGKETIYRVCDCGKKTKEIWHCKSCGRDKEKCEHEPIGYENLDLDIKEYVKKAKAISGLDVLPELIKGVRGTSNKSHIPENLVKGILRAKHSLNVNKDGTIRYDMTEMPMTAFYPREIGTSFERLKKMGYEKDIYGKEIISNDQLIELKPSDLVLPASEESLNEGGDKVLFRVGNFIDDLLKNFYKMKPYYNFKKKEDLIGHLVIGLAPHISASIIGRIIGFSKTQCCFAHPLWHSAVRRDCVYAKTKFVYYDLDKKEIFYEEIGNFVEEAIMNGAKIKKIDSVGTISVENKRRVLVVGINPDNRELVFKRVKYFIKGPITKKWVKVITATNREFVMTPTHKFMHLDDNKNFIFKDAKDAHVDDKIPVLNKFELDFDIKDKINLAEFFIDNLDKKNKKNIIFLNCEDIFDNLFTKNKKKIISLLGLRDNFKRWSKYASLLDFEKLMKVGLINYTDLPDGICLRHLYSNHKLPVIFDISKELLNLMGYYTAEGYSRSNKTVSQVSFRIFDKGLQKHLVWLIKSVFGIKASLGEEDSKITICSKLVYLLFTRCFKAGSGAYNKRVPNFIFSLPKDLIIEYISGYLDGDGSIVNQRNFIVFYSVSRSLLDDLALLSSRFGLISRYYRTKERYPGKKVLRIYKALGKEPKRHVLNHLVFSGVDAYKLKSILRLNNSIKADKLSLIKEANERRLKYNGKQVLLESASDYFIDYVKNIEFVNDESNSYCVEIDWKSKEDRNILWGEQIINTRCEGDEACVILLMDALLNFSRSYLPSHRGATQDAPLVLTSEIIASEVDEMVFDMDVVWEYPLEFYEACLEYKNPRDVAIEVLGNRIGKEGQYEGMGFTHDVSDMNMGVRCSAYKLLPTMVEKLNGQMEIAEKVRAVDEGDVARLVIDRHFIRDIRGNLGKFSRQQFRCVGCNEKFRRPPLSGICNQCGGKIIFTISEGSITKYLGYCIELSEKYDIPNYLRQIIDLTKQRVELVFGREKEKQEALGKWI